MRNTSSTDLYVETVMAFCAALDLSRPALIGCSIGGRIALELAHRHSDRFRALIGVESADYQEPWYDTAWLHRPDVHGGEVCAALVSGLVAPQSPAVHRHETLWQYMQGGPGVFRGDLYFYRVDGDLRGRLGGIRTDICPLYLLTGEYDFSCSPEDTLRTAQSIPGAQVEVMRELGHFPMSENPAQFRRYRCRCWTRSAPGPPRPRAFFSTGDMTMKIRYIAALSAGIVLGGAAQAQDTLTLGALVTLSEPARRGGRA